MPPCVQGGAVLLRTNTNPYVSSSRLGQHGPHLDLRREALDVGLALGLRRRGCGLLGLAPLVVGPTGAHLHGGTCIPLTQFFGRWLKA